MDMDEGSELRSTEELIQQWPERWEKFDETLRFLRSEVGKNSSEGSALRELLDVPIQEMLRYLLELSKSEISEEHFEPVFKVVLSIVNDQRINTDNGELIAIVAFSLELFARLFELYPNKCQPHMETMVTKVSVLINELAAVTTFGKKLGSVSTQAMKQFVGKDDDDDDEDDDDEEEDDLTDDDSRLFVWNQCSRVVMMVLENDTHRNLVASIINTLIPPVIKILKASDYAQLKMEASDLLEQLCMLSFQKSQVIAWEEIGNEPNVLEEFMNEQADEEDDPTSMIGMIQKNGQYHDAFPYCSIDLSVEDLQDLLHYLINLNITGGIDMQEVQVSALIGVLSCLAGKFEPEIASKVVFSCLDLVKKNISDSNEVVDRLTQFLILKEIFGLAPASIIQTRFTEMLTFIEGIISSESKKLKAVAGGGKKNNRGGRGGRGRGRGGGGGGPQKVDPEKEMQFKVIQKQLAVVLEKLYLRGGANIFDVADKFFTTTSSTFKSHDLHFTFLCALGLELAKEESASRPDYENMKKLLATKLEMGYKSMSDNLGSKFVSGKSKLEGCKTLSKISSCCFNNVAIFPEYLPRTLTCLIDVIIKDGAKVGPPAIVYLERVILANKSSEALLAKLPEIVENVATKFLVIPEEKREDQMLEFLQLVSCELLELIFFQTEFHPVIKSLIPTLAPSLKTIIKETGDTIKSFESGIMGEDDDEDDDDMPKLTYDLSSLAVKEEKKEENKDDIKVEPTTPQNPVAATTDASPFAFNFNSGSAPTTATPNPSFPKFDFGTPSTQGAPKFDFGGVVASGTPFQAPTFNFGPTPVAGEVATTQKSGSAGRGRGRGGPGTIENAITLVGRGRGAAGGGRGRGRGGRHNHDDCDDDCDEDDDDDDDDEDDDDDDDEDDDDMFGGEDDSEDPMAREASACLSALAVVTEMYKCGSDNVLFAELLTQSLETANFLKTVPEYAADTIEFLRTVEQKK
jgi:hypothetical protein